MARHPRPRAASWGTRGGEVDTSPCAREIKIYSLHTSLLQLAATPMPQWVCRRICQTGSSAAPCRENCVHSCPCHSRLFATRGKVLPQPGKDHPCRRKGRVFILGPKPSHRTEAARPLGDLFVRLALELPDTRGKIGRPQAVLIVGEDEGRDRA